jgi:hypothetical protein
MPAETTDLFEIEHIEYVADRSSKRLRRWRNPLDSRLRSSPKARNQSERGVPSDLIETVRWFSGTLDRTESSRTIVGLGLFDLGLGVDDKGTARDDRLM